MYGPQAAFVAEQFSPRLRYTGSSLAYTLAGVVGGAVAPLLFTAPLGTFHTWQPLAAYIAVTAALTVARVLVGRDAARWSARTAGSGSNWGRSRTCW
jgi:hypothetical protein